VAETGSTGTSCQFFCEGSGEWKASAAIHNEFGLTVESIRDKYENALRIYGTSLGSLSGGLAA
jgi:hypothetical protein